MSGHDPITYDWLLTVNNEETTGWSRGLWDDLKKAVESFDHNAAEGNRITRVQVKVYYEDQTLDSLIIDRCYACGNTGTICERCRRHGRD